MRYGKVVTTTLQMQERTSLRARPAGAGQYRTIEQSLERYRRDKFFKHVLNVERLRGYSERFTRRDLEKKAYMWTEKYYEGQY